MSSIKPLCLSLNPEDCAKHRGTLVRPNGREWPLADVLARVPPGWHTLVKQLLNDLWDIGFSGHLCQVKEKYGSLRFYVGSELNAVHERIDEAEMLSDKTCEQCGVAGSIRKIEGWYSTLCQECYDSRVS